MFRDYPEIIFGFSTKEGLERKAPFYFNMSLSVGDDDQVVEENREEFLDALEIPTDRLAYQEQVHGDTVTIVDSPGFVGESDALITSEPNLAIGVFSADCDPIFIYDSVKKVVAAVHSGWKGTEKKILEKALNMMKSKFKSNPKNMVAFIGPAISQKRYLVDEDVAKKFDEKYSYFDDIKYHLDVTKINYDMLLSAGLKEENIDVSQLCSYENKFLFSYRREGKTSGRALGVIMIKG
jgi:YfiH family protein